MKGRKPKRYSPERKLAALTAVARNGGDVYRAAKETGIPYGTLHHWVRQAQANGESLLDDEADLNERLEHLASQMVAAMPEKLNEASLQELARALSIVLASMNQTRAGKEKTSHAREKLAEILERYAAAGSAAGASEPPDG